MDGFEEEVYVSLYTSQALATNQTNSSVDYPDYDPDESFEIYNYWDLIPTAIVYGL